MNDLQAPVPFKLNKKNLLNWDHFLSQCSSKIYLPHGNGAIRRLTDLHGTPIETCEELSDNTMYVAYGSFQMDKRKVKGRLKQLRTLQAVKGKALGPAPGPGQVCSPRQLAKLDAGNSIFVDEPLRLISLFNDVESKIQNYVRHPSKLSDMWRTIDETDADVVPLIKVWEYLVRKFPSLKGRDYVREPAYAAATHRDDGETRRAVIHGGEFRPFSTFIVYFAKCMIGLRSQDLSQHLSFDDFRMAIALFGVKCRSLTDEATMFEKLEMPSRCGYVFYGRFCEWYAQKVCPEGAQIKMQGGLTKGRQRDWDGLTDAMLMLVRDEQAMDAVYDRIDFNANEMITLDDCARTMGEQHQLLDHKDAWVRSHAIIREQLGQDSQLSDLVDLGETVWIERGEFRMLMLTTLCFVKIASTLDETQTGPDHTFDENEFKRICSKLGDILLTKKDAGEAFSRINEDGVISQAAMAHWMAMMVYGEYMVVEEDLNVKHASIGQEFAVLEDQDDKPDTPTTPLKALSPPDKKIRKALMKGFDDVERQFRMILATPDGINELYHDMDSDNHGVLSLDEVEEYCNKKFPVMSSHVALLRAFMTLSRHPGGSVTLSDRGAIVDPKGEAWVASSEFKEFFTALLFYNKMCRNLGIKYDTSKMHIGHEQLSEILPLLGMRCDAIKCRKIFIGLQKGMGTDRVVTFDALLKWYSVEQLTRSQLHKSIKMSKKQLRKKADYIQALLELQAKVHEYSQDPEFFIKGGIVSKSKSGVAETTFAGFTEFVGRIYPAIAKAHLIRRAYHAIFMRIPVDNDLITETGLRQLFVTIYYTNLVWAEFSNDVEGDRALSKEEFTRGMANLAIRCNSGDLHVAYENMEGYEIGLVSIEAICKWLAQYQCPSIFAGEALEAQWAGLEPEFAAFAASSKRVQSMFTKMDGSTKHGIELEDYIRSVTTLYPLLNNTAAYLNAFQRATGKDGQITANSSNEILCSVGDTFIPKNLIQRTLLSTFVFHIVFDLYHISDIHMQQWVTGTDFKNVLLAVGVKASHVMQTFTSLSQAVKKTTGRNGLIRLADAAEAATNLIYPPQNGGMPGIGSQSPRKQRRSSKGSNQSRGRRTRKQSFGLSALSLEGEMSPQEKLRRFAKLEQEITTVSRSENRLDRLWQQLDSDEAGVVSLVRVHTVLSDLYPFLADQRALCVASYAVNPDSFELSPETMSEEFIDHNQLARLLVFAIHTNMYVPERCRIVKEKNGTCVVDLDGFRSVLASFDMAINPERSAGYFDEFQVTGETITCADVCKWVVDYRLSGRNS